MIRQLPALVLLHAACAVLYVALAALVLLRAPPSRTARLARRGLPGNRGLGRRRRHDRQTTRPAASPAGWRSPARRPGTASSCTCIGARWRSTDQLRQVFTTMGLLALLLVGGTAADRCAVGPAGRLAAGRCGTAIRLGFAVCNILLLENLYFNTPSDARWHINLLCVALAGLSLYDLVLYADAALFHRVSLPLFEGAGQRHSARGAADRASPRRATGAGRSIFTSRATSCSTAAP